jgi:hypothetical protein
MAHRLCTSHSPVRFAWRNAAFFWQRSRASDDKREIWWIKIVTARDAIILHASTTLSLGRALQAFDCLALLLGYENARRNFRRVWADRDLFRNYRI